MPDPIESYLAKLRKKLSRNFDRKKVDQIIAEAGTHLQDSAARFQQEEKQDSDQATTSALEAYGDPKKVAGTYLKQSESLILGIRPTWFVFMGTLLALVCWDLHWMWLWGYFDNDGEVLENYLAGFCSFVGFCVMVWGVRAGKRSFWRSILGAGLAIVGFFVFALSYTIIGSDGHHQGISRFHFDRDVATIQQALPRINRISNYLERGKAVFAKASLPKDVPTDLKNIQLTESELGLKEHEIFPSHNSLWRDSNYVIPYQFGAFVEVSGPVTGLDWASSFKAAKQAWLDDEPQDQEKLQSAKKGFQSLLASAQQAKEGRVFFFNPDVYGDTMFWTAALLIFLLFTDGLMAGFRHVKRKARDRALA
jgi:hypothetical protein